MKIVRVWDLPTRMFHWCVVVCFVGLFTTALTGGFAMEWHFRFGYAMASLLVFRFVWGFLGGHWSRFSSFLYSPRSIRDYLAGRAPAVHLVGHNPLGAASVFLMLILLAVQVSTGLFSEDKGDAFGPLSMMVSHSTVLQVSSYHKNIGKFLLLVTISVHISAIAFYFFRRGQNLVRPMVSGDKALAEAVIGSQDNARSRLKALFVFGFSVLLVMAIVQLGN
jgi:cytochrome b